MKAHNFLDLTGKRYGRLVVVEYVGVQKSHTYYMCECDCGKMKKIRASHLQSERTRSCGCLNRELTINRSTTHGLSKRFEKHPLYGVWSSMLCRCYHPKTRGYKYYGGRGIRVCDKWHSFAGFHEDMGATYEYGLSLDRIEVNGNYELFNCRWATQAMQSRNRTDNRYITYNGETKIITDWATDFNIKMSTLSVRLESGWDIERALTQPVAQKRRFYI